MIVDDEAMARRRLHRLLSLDPSVSIVAECAGAVEALQVLRRGHIDLLFLDISLPEMDGLALLRALPTEIAPAVVFVTAYDQYAIQAFEASAIDYLLKPFHPERFAKTLERVKSQISKRPPREYWLVLRSGASIVRLETSLIHWIESANNHVCVHCGRATHIARETLSSVEQRLPPGRFLRIHRSVIVNASQVREVAPLRNGDYRIVLKDGAPLTLSRTFKDKLPSLLS